DAFAHFKPQGRTVDTLDLDVYIGPVLVAEIPAEVSIITAQVLSSLTCFEAAGQPITRILLKTRNSQQDWVNRPFNPDFVHLEVSAAAFLTERGIRLVGVDYLSVDGFSAQNVPVHHHLMDHGVYILEGLYLQQVPPGWYDLICLPLKIHQGDGAPARV